MKIEQLEELVKNSAKMGKKEFTDIAKLIEEYPYFQTAHMLYSLAAKNTNAKNFEDIIAKASAFISNREILYNKVNSIVPEKSDSENLVVSIVDKGTDKIKSITTVDNRTEKPEQKSESENITEAEKNIEINIKPQIKEEKEKIDKPEINIAETKTPKQTEPPMKGEKLTQKGKQIHSTLINDIIKPIVESEKRTPSKNISETKTDNTKTQVFEKTEIKEEKPEIKIITETKTEENKTPEVKIITKTKEETDKTPEIKTTIEPEKKIQDSKSITEDIFNKIANLKNENKKTERTSDTLKKTTISKADLFKNKNEDKETEKKIEETKIEQPEKPKIIIKTDEKTQADNKQDGKPENETKTKINIIKKDIEIEKRTEKPAETENKIELEVKEETKKIISAEEKPENETKPKINIIKKDIQIEKITEKPAETENKIELEVKEETKKIISAEEKPEIIEEKPVEIEKITGKTEKKEVKIITEKPVDKKTDGSKQKDAAESLLERIKKFKKSNKNTEHELIDKFIKEEPRLDRGKEINIKGDISKESAKEKDPVVTELMANILINQGHYDKAIDIFNKLILKNPEKKDYFASKILETEKMK